MQKTASPYPLVLSALLCALTAALSQLIIPIPPVPATLALLGVHLCAALLGGRQAALCVGAYLLMGLCGLPVFAGFAGGPGVLLGPTGGFLLGYLPCAWLTGTLCRRESGFARLCLAMAAGTVCCYACGALYFMLVSGSGPAAALTACVLPFIPGDAAKAALAAALTLRLRRALPHM